jgi:glutathione synthase/RimK-type ligase-like ATP-grasp enzyme
MIALRVATCRLLPEPDPDEPVLAAALVAGGFDAAFAGWDDPAVDWDAAVPTILRSTWNYPRAPEAFLAWLDRASAAAPLFNPPDIVRANVHKRYLLELAARGVPVVPTVLIERGGRCELADVARDLGARSLVIKPEIGAASFGARRFAADDPAAAAHLAALTARGAALVQPYLASVEAYGERSLVWIDGALSHAMRKAPRLDGDHERVDAAAAIADDERAIAEAAIAPVAGRVLYARVDLARDAAGRPVVMELELAEPSLYLAQHPSAAERLVAALRRALGA